MTLLDASWRKLVTSLALGSAVLALAFALGFPALAQGRPRLPKPHPDLPDAFRQVLPRGRIAAVDRPRFVPAAEAEISDDAWVLGVAEGGQAKAYSLNLLNHHEVVNDEIGGRPIAAVW